jgi:dihydrodipicolinate synthase/N-acetylneuraminate lyase
MGVFERLREGLVIPAHPLCLTAERRVDEAGQRALTRYYVEAGAGGVAVGVHTTQFAIRDLKHDLLEMVLRLAEEETRGSGVVRVAGVCGETGQALREAELAAGIGYDAALVSLGALAAAPAEALLKHLTEVSRVMPVFGFYLQPAVGGRLLPYEFWLRACEIEELRAVKIAPFNRYQTLDVMRAVAESGREDVSLYTGNDDNIVADLLTEYEFGGRTVRMVGGLLGQWAVGTRSAVRLLERVKRGDDARDLLRVGAQLTDLNAALFDAANGFRGCIAGIHEVLVRQGRMAGRWCLDPAEDLSPGQGEEIDRVMGAYGRLLD